MILEAPASRIVDLNEEHAYVSLGPGDDLALGRLVQVVPKHVCAAVDLYDELVVVRDGNVVGCWKVAARGRSR